MIRNFFKDSIVYTLANLLTRGLGFVLLPVYTRVISKYEYGLFDYLTSIGLLLGVIITFEVTQAIYRFIPENESDESKQVKLASTGFWFSFLMYTFFCIVCIIFSNELSTLLLDNSGYSDLIIITSLLFLSNALLYNLTSLMRAKLLSRNVVFISLFNAVCVAFFSLMFILYFDFGLVGLISGQLFGVTCSIIVAYLKVKNLVKFTFCVQSLKMMLAFSAPLIFSSIGVVLSMFVDRVMLKEFLGAEQLAPYAVAIRIASIVSLLMVGFQSALTPLIYANYEKEETPKKIAQLFHFYLVASLFSLVVLGFSSHWLVYIVAGEQYVEAANYVNPLVCSALLSSMYLFFPGLSIVRKTSLIAAINVFTGILNVILNYIFIPKYGALGAAYSTLSSVFISLLLNARMAQDFYKIPINNILTFFTFFILALILFFNCINFN